MEQLIYNPHFKENIITEFSVSHNISNSQVMKSVHFHDVFEIYLTMTDGIMYFINDKIIPLNRGDMLVFNSMDLHKSIVPDGLNYERYLVLFDPQYALDLSTPGTELLECFKRSSCGYSNENKYKNSNGNEKFNKTLHLEEHQVKEYLYMFNKAEYYINNKVYGSDIYKKIVLAEILLYVNNLYRKASKATSRSQDQYGEELSTDYNRVKPVLIYINLNLDKDLTLDKLASEFFVNKYHLSDIFKKATGFTINQYIINRRVLKAKEYLKNGISVSQSGEMVGFHNVSHFIRTFKNLTGLPPKQYFKKIMR